MSAVATAAEPKAKVPKEDKESKVRRGRPPGAKTNQNPDQKTVTLRGDLWKDTRGLMTEYEDRHGFKPSVEQVLAWTIHVTKQSLTNGTLGKVPAKKAKVK